ncbi:MAG: hypothetical protein MRY32_09685 [Rickettsiales bacterium]|nr:hypothetical protein [Rickettsiales bacterium]
MLATTFLAISLTYMPQSEIDKLPLMVRKDLNYAGEICKALGRIFFFDRDYIDMIDFNQDGVIDYVVDTRGYDCGRYEDSLYGGNNGKALYMYLSQPDNSYEKVYNSYVYEYRVKRNYGEAPYFDVWIRGDVGYKVNFIRHQWTGADMEVVDQEIGVEVPTQLWKRFD